MMGNGSGAEMKEMESGDYEAQVMHDFMGQRIPQSPLIFTHHGGLQYEDLQSHLDPMRLRSISTSNVRVRTLEEMHSTNEVLMQNSTKYEEKGIATVFTWSYGGKEVFVEGSWDNWEKREQLRRSRKEFVILKVLPSGVYHYRFIVDGERRCSTEVTRMQDENGNECNILELKDHVPENIRHRKEFELPQSPESSYDCPLNADDYSKEPHTVPEHLGLTVLNASCDMSNADCSLRPHYSTLGHLYGQTDRDVLALGTTNRFRDKYITAIVYKSLQR